MLAILNKELRSYFSSASAYIFMGIFLLLAGVFFALSNILGQQPNVYYNSVLGSLNFVFLLIVPILTMRIISEESKMRTDQLLLTAPITITKIVLGKYLAAVLLFTITLLITGLYPLILSLFGNVAALEILTAYIGFFLMGSCFIAIGVFVSSLTDNQVVAAVGTFGVLLFIWILDWIQSGLPTSRNSGIVFAVLLVIIISTIIYTSTKNIYVSAITAIIGFAVTAVIFIAKKELFEGLISKFFSWFSLLERNNMFSMGVLSLNSVVYFISFSFVFVFLTIQMIEKRRWS
jgi:ABC-2 type transport system permease protein